MNKFFGIGVLGLAIAAAPIVTTGCAAATTQTENELGETQEALRPVCTGDNQDACNPPVVTCTVHDSRAFNFTTLETTLSNAGCTPPVVVSWKLNHTSFETNCPGSSYGVVAPVVARYSTISPYYSSIPQSTSGACGSSPLAPGDFMVDWDPNCPSCAGTHSVE